jgi:hypothetical protein
MSLPFRKLGLGGGGIKGILHIGALQELSNYQPLIFPDGVYGVSIGSVIGTYVAFGLPMDHTIVDLTKKYLTFDKAIPKLNIKDVTTMFSSKGLFNMDVFRKTLIDMFNEVGVDIASKRICDAKMPLYIVASNITKGVPTIFSSNTPVLDAIMCSACIPGLFKPYELYGQLYIDGGLLVPNLGDIVKDGLVISLYKKKSVHITPKSIGGMDAVTYIRNLEHMAIYQYHEKLKTDLTVNIHYPGLVGESDLSKFDLEDVLKTGRDKLGDFLRSKRLC